MIRFEDIEIRFGSFVAIKDLNLTIKEGEFFTLLGPSGCGKTTTLRSLVGFIKPSKGKIKLKDKDITNTPVEKRNINLVFQSYALFPTLSVYENIAFGLKVKKMPKAEISRQVKSIAAKVDLSELQLTKKVSELSGGQQQRVAIARALVLNPEILALDEPLSNLDAKLRKQLRHELKTLQKKFGITTIYVTHDQEEALTLSDHIAVFNNGVVEQVGTPEEIYNHSKTEFICNFIGESNDITEFVNHSSVQSLKKVAEKGQKHYIRIEKVFILPSEDDADDSLVVMEGEVTAREFYGIYTKYTVTGSDIIVHIIEKDLNKSFPVGAFVKAAFHTDSILTYK
ncbi:ABC transporter ATP-binding protein [Lacrimispora brassicae]